MPEFVFASAAMQKVAGEVEVMARASAPVLITGESGTGKEVVAEMLHRQSARSAKPLVKVNCGALPRELVESELFGAEVGAYTGSVRQRKGAFRTADGGTLFLDELAEMPIESQPKLLRVLQDQQVQPVGAAEPVPVDVRLIAATNQSPEEAVQGRRLRADLYYRLSVLEIALPPLRARREDILKLAEKFLADMDSPPALSTCARARLLAYDWPGNVRELQSVILRSVLLNPGVAELTADRLRFGRILESSPTQSTGKPSRFAMIEALTASGGVVRHAADDLGISHKTFYQKLAAYGIDPSTFRGQKQ